MPWQQRGGHLAGEVRGFLELRLKAVLRTYATGRHTRVGSQNIEPQSAWSLGTPRNLRLQHRGWGKTLTGGQLEMPPLPKKNSSLCTTMEVCLQRRGDRISQEAENQCEKKQSPHCSENNFCLRI